MEEYIFGPAAGAGGASGSGSGYGAGGSGGSGRGGRGGGRGGYPLGLGSIPSQEEIFGLAETQFPSTQGEETGDTQFPAAAAHGSRSRSHTEDVEEVEATPSTGRSISRRRKKKKVSDAPVRKPRSSKVFSFFGQPVIRTYDDGTVEEVVDCPLCGEVLTASSAAGTSHLKRHEEACKKNQNMERGQTTLQVTSEGVGSWRFDPAAERDAHARFVAASGLPLNFGENPHWKDYIKRAFFPNYQPVTANTVRSDIIKIYNDIRLELVSTFSLIKTSIACTSDIWSGRTKTGYLALTAHFVDNDWILQKRLIGFRKISWPHNASTISDTIINIFESYQISGKIFSITFDNASSNNAAVSALKTVLRNHNPNLFHQKCACHIINLIVKDGICDEIKNYVEKIRNTISFIMSAGARIQQFHHVCASHGLPEKRFPLDVQHRWNSLYLMLVNVLPYRQPLITYSTARDGIESDDRLNDEDFEYAECFVGFLKPFYDATVQLSGVYYSTSVHALNHLACISHVFMRYSEVPFFAPIVERMKAKYMKYWGGIPLLYCIALCLDPRAKIVLCSAIVQNISTNLGLDTPPHTAASLQARLEELYDSYSSKYGTSSASSSSVAPRASTSSSSGYNPWALVADVYTTPYASQPRRELETYLNMDHRFLYVQYQHDPASFDVIEWWKSQSGHWPILSLLARDILSTPVSSVACEQVFSLSGNILDERRSKLKANILEATMCVQDWERARLRSQENPDLWIEDFGGMSLSND